MRVRWVALGAGLALVAGSVVAVRAADHHDSKTESIADGCGREDLALLGDAAATMIGGAHPTVAASWVYVNGDNRPKTVEGTALGVHTAGTDLFGVHDTYDLNVDVKPDADYEELLSSRNAEESPPQIHDEWEAGLAPLFAWPAVGDHVRQTGSHIWDCGHWQSEARKIPQSDHIPGDPLAEAGVEEIGGESIEIHPISEFATWRTHGDFVPRAGARAVHASRLDVAISNQGGKAKGVEECALLSRRKPAAAAARLAAGRGCSSVQKVAGRRYVYELKAPGKRPSRRSRLMVHQEVRYAHRAPKASEVDVSLSGDTARITVPFDKVTASNQLQDFGATWHAWWSDDKTPVHRFRVTLTGVTINNNLDTDSGDDASNPLITPDGEWNMFVEMGGQWTNLHDPRPGFTDLIPALGAVPSAKTGPVALSTAKVSPVEVAVGDRGSVHLFSDARECDQPGYVDCPTKNELATTGKSAGRSEVSVPVSQLVGRSTALTLHPPLCATGASCPEDKNPVSLCPQGCYSVSYRIDDLDATPGSAAKVAIAGDGTRAGTRVGATEAMSLAWWIDPITRYGPDQEEENVTVARVIGELLARSPKK
jgi:hypothetical protein